MHERSPRSFALLGPLLAMLLLSACGTTGPTPDVWTGTSILDNGTSYALRLEVREHDGTLAGSYHVGASRGDFEGTVDGETLTATLAPSDACTYALAGTISEGALEGAFAPDVCPGGQSGTWSLTRR